MKEGIIPPASPAYAEAPAVKLETRRHREEKIMLRECSAAEVPPHHIRATFLWSNSGRKRRCSVMQNLSSLSVFFFKNGVGRKLKKRIMWGDILATIY